MVIILYINIRIQYTIRWENIQPNSAKIITQKKKESDRYRILSFILCKGTLSDISTDIAAVNIGQGIHAHTVKPNLKMQVIAC